MMKQEEFYEKLAGDADIKTSQPAPGDVMDMWDKALEEYDEVVHIPMSAGLSSSCETAIMLSQDYAAKIGGRGEKACRCWKERGRN